MKLTKSHLRQMIKEEIQKEVPGGQFGSVQPTQASSQDLLMRTQDLYRKFTTEGFDDASRDEVSAIFNELQNVKEKHFKEKGRDAEYNTLMRLDKAIDEISKSVRYKDYAILQRAQGIPTKPDMDWLMSQ